MAGWLVARWFLGGEMVGGEIPWWRDDRIPIFFHQLTQSIIILTMVLIASSSCSIILISVNNENVYRILKVETLRKLCKRKRFKRNQQVE